MTMWPLLFNFSGGSRVPVAPWLLAPSMASLEDLLCLFSTLSKAHLGYLHWVRAFLFLFDQLRIAAHNFGPMGEGVDYTKLGREVMVAVPL